MIRSYLTYWWKLSLATFGNWGSSHLFMPPQALGWFHAKMDQRHGITKFYYNGLRPLWHADVELTLAKDYQIEYLNVNNLDHSEWHELYENAYNRVARELIKKKFGVNVVDLCLTKAEFRFREQVRQLAANETLKIA